MDTNTGLQNELEELQFDTSARAISRRNEIIREMSEMEEKKQPFNYLKYVAEQINRLPKGFVLHASHYNTDDSYVIHFWNDSGNSWDIYLDKHACE